MTHSDWTPDQPIVSLKNVCKSFGDLEVLKGISFDVLKGEVICIIGPSGSGKSTLIRTINGLTPVTSGSVKVEGQEVFVFRHDSVTGEEFEVLVGGCELLRACVHRGEHSLVWWTGSRGGGQNSRLTKLRQAGFP